jgi:hypothetical protein
MSLFVIEAVRFDAKGDRVEKVRWGRIKGREVGPPGWATEPDVADVIEVVDALNAGDEVLTIFSADGQIVVGPQVHVVTYEPGFEGIETVAQDMPNRTLRDMPTF